MFAEPDGSDPETIQFYTTTGKSLQTPSSTRTSRSPNNFAGFFAPVGSKFCLFYVKVTILC